MLGQDLPRCSSIPASSQVLVLHTVLVGMDSRLVVYLSDNTNIDPDPADTRRLSNVVLMLSQRHRRWTSINTALDTRL